jgi:putative NIF3 family GTP cyclohydrolase 1 type 2
VKRAAVCAGSCGDLVHTAVKAGCDLYLTGELRHHDALAAAKAGMTVVCVLHSNSERPTLDVLRRRLVESFQDVQVFVSEQDRDPFQVL